MPDKPHSELLAHVRASLDSYFEPDWEDVAEVYKSYARLVEQNETLRQALHDVIYTPAGYESKLAWDRAIALVSNPAKRDADA